MLKVERRLQATYSLQQCCKQQFPKKNPCNNVASSNFRKGTLATMLQAVISEKDLLLQCCKQQFSKKNPYYNVASINFRKSTLATLLQALISEKTPLQHCCKH
jgi:hypothetical protein